VFADTLYVAIDLEPGSELAIDDSHAERALYLLEGQAQLDGADLPEKHLVVLDPGSRPRLRALTPVKAMLLGGEPLDAPRHLWWNFVSSSRRASSRPSWTGCRTPARCRRRRIHPLPER
jgi:redox-sensitive bicupin YhaK (pirin superfamily)